jgi:hypothetical protein
MVRVIVDTNALVSAVEWRVDLWSELERILVVPFTVAVVEGTFAELDAVAAKSGKHKQRVKVAKMLLVKKGVERLPGAGHVDDVIVGLADRKSTFVVTQDQALKRRLKAKGVPVITIRQKKFLQLVG